MDIIYARNPLVIKTEKSVFLAGPTPRSKEVASWRPAAISLFRGLSLDLTLLVPEDEKGGMDPAANDEDQIGWEESAMLMADCILFWIPRNLQTLPGFTTNIEFGRWMDSGKIVLGAPLEAEKMRYILYYTKILGIPTANTLPDTVLLAYLMMKQRVMKF